MPIPIFLSFADRSDACVLFLLLLLLLAHWSERLEDLSPSGLSNFT